jgi:hypothetical protein
MTGRCAIGKVASSYTKTAKLRKQNCGSKRAKKKIEYAKKKHFSSFYS